MNNNASTLPTTVEPAEPEELETTDTGLVPKETRQSVEDILFLSDNIEKIIDAQNKIRMNLLRLAQPGDWFLFKNADKPDDKGKAELGFAGSYRIATSLGVNFENWERRKVEGTDEYGPWYRWEFECDAVFRNRRVRCYGRAGSRTKFFGKSHGAHKALRDIDEGDIIISAWRGAAKEGVKSLFGLHHMDPDYMREFKINLVEVSGFEFKGDKGKAEATQSVTRQLMDVREKKGEKWTQYQVYDDEGVIYKTFDKKVAEAAKAAVATKQPVTINFTVDKKYGPQLVSLGDAGKPAEVAAQAGA